MQNQSLAEVLFIDMVNGRSELSMDKVEQYAEDALAYESMFRKVAAKEFQDDLKVTGVRKPARLVGCKACYGSGGKAHDPCKKCSGTGKVFV